MVHEKQKITNVPDEEASLVFSCYQSVPYFTSWSWEAHCSKTRSRN